MELRLHVTAMPVKDRGFIPKLDFTEMDGAGFTSIPYWFKEDAIRDTKEEALALGKAHARQIIIDKYGNDMLEKVSIRED